MLGKSVKSSIICKMYDSVKAPVDDGVGHVVTKPIFLTGVISVENVIYDKINRFINDEIKNKIIK